MNAADYVDVIDIANEMIAFEEVLALEEMLEMPSVEATPDTFAFAHRS